MPKSPKNPATPRHTKSGLTSFGPRNGSGILAAIMYISQQMNVIAMRTITSSNAGTGGSNWFNTLTATFMNEKNTCESMTSRRPTLLRTHPTMFPWMVSRYSLHCIMHLVVVLDACTLMPSWTGSCARAVYVFSELVLMVVLYVITVLSVEFCCVHGSYGPTGNCAKTTDRADEFILMSSPLLSCMFVYLRNTGKQRI